MAQSRKRILLVGAGGVIGRAVHEALRASHEVITAGLADADHVFDLADAKATAQALGTMGELDAVVSTAGRAHFRPLAAIEPAALEDSVYGLGLRDKLLGQVNLALAARAVLREGGSITLTSGTTSDEPILGGSSLSMVNGAIEHWAMAAATELPRGLRLNVVSPSLVEGTPAPAVAAFPGFELVSGARVALAYLRCLESGITGRVIRV
ncbi:short chain dehydrogenase [Ramlibacter rhizophilus]|uniref:Short chain dehydrogenase n=1 Tax=Ramlibacter rhizophilus TaxID=1781167 RepID=A0A4Z0BGK2_9BURK|nr:short chain dehydrogenase [Ramlibacter rhizophilus]TFY97264.1 short chain dehydrogenase [Ramlibacter rhizophilus]